jgi:hypothetical protein
VLILLMQFATDYHNYSSLQAVIASFNNRNLKNITAPVSA